MTKLNHTAYIPVTAFGKRLMRIASEEQSKGRVMETPRMNAACAVGEGITEGCKLELEYHAMRQQRDELVAAIENALISIYICAMPQDTTVANNKTILRITADGLNAAIAKSRA